MVLSKHVLEGALPYANYYNTVVVNEFCFSSPTVSFSIDTRQLIPGEFFIAMGGQQVDGHQFVAKAVEQGAGGLIVKDASVLSTVAQEWLQKHPVIIVPDTYQALIDLAKYWRAQLNIPVVGITGSVGKTTTKEMMRSILQCAGRNAYVSWKNQNTDIGLSLNILKTHKDHDVAVFEMGINEKGEMAQLASIARPTIAAITNVSYAHGQGLGSVVDVAYEKRQIFSHFSTTDVGVIAGDQPLLAQVCYHHPVARFGFKTKNQVQARKLIIEQTATGELQTRFTLKWYDKKVMVTLPAHHQGYISNALAASTIGYLLQLPLESIVEGLQVYRGHEGRFEVKSLKNGLGKIINDCYNANPESMRVALEAFEHMTTKGKKIAVLGDMLELGDRERYWHRQIGRLLGKSSSIDEVVLVGERALHMMATASPTMEVKWAKNWEQALPLLEQILSNDALVLVKASNGMHLKKIVEEFSS